MDGGSSACRVESERKGLVCHLDRRDGASHEG